MSSQVPTRSWRALALVGEFITSLAVGGVAWAAWLGWDNSYYYDAAAGTLQGPYRPSQVIACAVTVGVLTALLACDGTLSLWPQVSHSASGPRGPLYMIGSIMLFGGLVVGTAVASTIGYAARALLPSSNE